MHAEHAQHNGQQARCQAALLGIACRRGVVLLGRVRIIGLLGRLAVLGRLVLRGSLLLLLGLLGRAIRRLGLIAGIGRGRLWRPGRLWHMERLCGGAGEVGAGVVWGRGIGREIRLQGQVGHRLFRIDRLLLGGGGLGALLDGLGFPGLPFCRLGGRGIVLLL